MATTSSELLSVAGEAKDDILADCYVFLLRERYERLAMTRQRNMEDMRHSGVKAVSIPAVQAPSAN